MKVQIEILEDQLELLEKIKELPKLIEKHIGKLPQAFPGQGQEINEIQQQVANLEFKCKQMIFDTCIVKEQLAKIFDDVHLDSEKYKRKDWDD